MAATRLVVGAAKTASPVFSGGVNSTWVTGKPHQFPAVNDPGIGEQQKKFRMFLYKEENFCQYGLLKHDQLEEDHVDVARRIRDRMTQDQKDAMYFRMGRAILLSNLKRVLPKQEWTPFDAPHLYMDNIIKQIEFEDFEKKMTKAALNDYDDNWERLFQFPFRIVNYFKIKSLREDLARRFCESVV